MERLKILKNHITPLVNVIETDSLILLTLNRPQTLNSLNFEMLFSIIHYLEQAKTSNRYWLITGEPRKFLGSGGDLVLTTEQFLEIPEYIRTLHHMFYLTTKVKAISLWTGYVIGSTAGLACSCELRVAFPSSKYSMPETEIGLFPNVGGSFYLSHNPPSHIGLYLGLTGHTLKGPDCYFYNFCKYFILDEDYVHLISSIKNSPEPSKILDFYHKEPKKEWSELYPVESIIKDCFYNKTNIEDIIQSLKHHPSVWAKKTLQKIIERCPLSLKVAFKAFNMGCKQTFKQVLEMEYCLNMSMMLHYRYNFINGVRAKLRKKIFSDWVPAFLEDVSEEMVNEMFGNKDGLKLDLGFLDF